MPTLTENQARAAQQQLEPVLYALKQVIVGQDALLERLLLALLVGGHVLVEGAPGLAKTLALRTLASVLSVDFQRIQFTPDLLPSDLIGTRVFLPGQGAFTTERGPIFAHFILADEVNRAPAKVQSALLEAMQEHQVTIGKETFPLPEPFLVMATQNPLEHEGTYALPEAQLDRFLFKLVVDPPGAREEMTILQRVLEHPPPAPTPILDTAAVQHLAGLARSVYVDPAIQHTAVDWVQATRQLTDPDCRRWVRYGVSPRGTIALIAAAKAMALLRGRAYATPEDLQAVALDCLRHRLILSYAAHADGQTAEGLLQQLTHDFSCGVPAA